MDWAESQVLLKQFGASALAVGKDGTVVATEDFPILRRS